MKLLFNIDVIDESLCLLIEALQPEALFSNERRAPTKVTQEKRALGFKSLIAELLLNNLEQIEPSYHQMSKSAFTDHLFGYDIFKKVVDVCNAEGLIHIAVGKRADGESVATTFRLSEYALSYFDGWINSTQGDFLKAFNVMKPSLPLVRAKYRRPAKVKGVKRPAKEVPLKVLLKRQDVKDQWRSLELLNHYYSKHELLGIRFCGLQRIYSNFNQSDPLVGGRLYAIGGSYQTLRSVQRKALKIDGEAVCELDVKSSHLVLYAFVKAATSEKPNILTEPASPYLSDPYSFENIPRPVVKAMITLLIGSSGKSRTWTPDQKVTLLEKEGIDLAQFEFKSTKARVLERYSFLERADGQDIDWAFLQVREADTMYSAIRRLAYEFDIPAYPVHDSIIVKQSNRTVAQTVLLQSFSSIIGYEPAVECSD